MVVRRKKGDETFYLSFLVLNFLEQLLHHLKKVIFIMNDSSPKSAAQTEDFNHGNFVAELENSDFFNLLHAVQERTSPTRIVGSASSHPLITPPPPVPVFS